MKCAAVTVEQGETIACEARFPHVEHWGAANGITARWKSSAELDEGVKANVAHWAQMIGRAERDTRTDPSKVQWSQLAPFLPALELVARALMFGAQKHGEKPGEEAWRTVENIAHVFGDKIARHGLSHVMGQKFDPQSKLPHLAHMIANALIVLTNEGEIIK